LKPVDNEDLKAIDNAAPLLKAGLLLQRYQGAAEDGGQSGAN
jgi:hypothetical protein